MSDNITNFILPLTVIGLGAIALIVISKPLSDVVGGAGKVYDDVKGGFDQLSCELRNPGRNCKTDGSYDAGGGPRIDEIDYSKRTKALNAKCDITSDCSSIEVSGGPPSDGTKIRCVDHKCQRVSLLQ
jgi:hypothetical protein